MRSPSSLSLSHPHSLGIQRAESRVPSPEAQSETVLNCTQSHRGCATSQPQPPRGRRPQAQISLPPLFTLKRKTKSCRCSINRIHPVASSPPATSSPVFRVIFSVTRLGVLLTSAFFSFFLRWSIHTILFSHGYTVSLPSLSHCFMFLPFLSLYCCRGLTRAVLRCRHRRLAHGAIMMTDLL